MKAYSNQGFPIRPKIHLIDLKNIPIFEQLLLEESLLRASGENFCLINRGSSRAIVMGISGQPEQLLALEKVREEQIPVIKRFSGGGTVIVDENTLFITFIMAKKDLEVPPFPEPILRWSAELYQDAWQIPGFQMRENDYCIQDKKCGGNAQYIQRDRWLHHTSFLWDYRDHNMDFLRLPSRRPKYRENRDHKEFLLRMKEHAPNVEWLIEQLKTRLGQQFTLASFDLSLWKPSSYRQSTQLIYLHREGRESL